MEDQEEKVKKEKLEVVSGRIGSWEMRKRKSEEREVRSGRRQEKTMR